RNPALFFPSHLASQFPPPLFPGLKGLPGLCPCCPSTSSTDQRSSSVAELRRKAQEHSAALLHSLQHSFQQHHALSHLPPVLQLPALTSLHQALVTSRKPLLQPETSPQGAPPASSSPEHQ
ncbi:hypothetical protein AAG570_005986, partial [Ranatra chinensis]